MIENETPVVEPTQEEINEQGVEEIIDALEEATGVDINGDGEVSTTSE